MPDTVIMSWCVRTRKALLGHHLCPKGGCYGLKGLSHGIRALISKTGVRVKEDWWSLSVLLALLPQTMNAFAP